jgi:hypothetical protein
MQDDPGNEIPVPALADHDAGRPFKNPRQEKASKKPLMPAGNDDPSSVFQMLLNLLSAFESYTESLRVES